MLHICISWTQKKSNFLSPAKRFPSKLILIRFSSVQFSRSVVSDSFRLVFGKKKKTKKKTGTRVTAYPYSKKKNIFGDV